MFRCQILEFYSLFNPYSSSSFFSKSCDTTTSSKNTLEDTEKVVWKRRVHSVQCTVYMYLYFVLIKKQREPRPSFSFLSSFWFRSLRILPWLLDALDKRFCIFFSVFLLLILGSQPPFTPSCLQSSSLFWCYFFSLVLVPDKDILASRIFSVVANIGTRRGIKRFSRAWDYYFCKDSLFSKACHSLYLWMWHSLYVWHFFYAIRVKNEEKLQHLHLLFTWSLGIQQK